MPITTETETESTRPIDVAIRMRAILDDSAARKAIIKRVYEARRDREVNPEGAFDKAGRWEPSARENAGGSGTRWRNPSRAWPYSYMIGCRTRQHCTVLVDRALAGHAVPDDVRKALGLS